MYLSYPQDKIDTHVIVRFALAQMSVQVYVLLNNSKQNTTSLSVLASRTAVLTNTYCEYSQKHNVGIYKYMMWVFKIHILSIIVCIHNNILRVFTNI